MNLGLVEEKLYKEICDFMSLNNGESFLGREEP
jgi:hypothetical protein